MVAIVVNMTEEDVRRMKKIQAALKKEGKSTDINFNMNMVVPETVMQTPQKSTDKEVG